MIASIRYLEFNATISISYRPRLHSLQKLKLWRWRIITLRLRVVYVRNVIGIYFFIQFNSTLYTKFCMKKLSCLLLTFIHQENITIYLYILYNILYIEIFLLYPTLFVIFLRVITHDFYLINEEFWFLTFFWNNLINTHY